MKNSDLVTFSLFINDKEADPAHQIISIEVNHEADQISSAILGIAVSMLSDDILAADSPDFTLGNTVTIKAGYSGNDQIIYNGVITSNEISLSSVKAPLFLVGCTSEAAKPIEKIDPVLELVYGDSILSFEAKIDKGIPGVNGNVKFQGSSLVVPGALISLKNVGSKFSGHVPVLKVSHDLRDGQWTTDVKFGSVMEQPASVVITDANLNKIELSYNGIMIESAGNIHLKASQNITMEADLGINVLSSDQLKLSAAVIKMDALASLGLSGGAYTELSASDEVSIKGGIVMIN